MTDTAPSTAPQADPAAAENAPPARLFIREDGIEYWRVERVARFLDVTRKRIYQLVQEKHLRAISLGPRQMRVSSQSLEDYLKERLLLVTGASE